MTENLNTDHLIVGSGIAGLSLALKLANQSQTVLVLSKGNIKDNNTWHAQGGIASVLSEDDSFDDHISDTTTAGVGLCRPEIVDLVVRNGPQAINHLIAVGVDFTKSTTGTFPYHLTREGGHSKRRVIHSHDLTGKEVLRALIKAANRNSRITILENQLAVDLVTTDKYCPSFSLNRCLGAYILDRSSQKIYLVKSRATYLCTGGHGKVYLYTTNPDSATGDGVAMGWRAGCRVANLEFMQFHPTCLSHPESKSFLISEALRGEGALIRGADGNPLVERIDARGSLAPRDIVARAIDFELKKTGLNHLYLDARSLGEDKIRDHFPNIHSTCLKLGIDISKEMIPVVPAAHYSCGGLMVDEWGRTNISHLFAIGETACTGLHGANRLASNSLLEALVFADRVADFISRNPLPEVETYHIPQWNSGNTPQADELVVLSHNWDEIRRLMWHYVGIVRSNRRLQRALTRIEAIRQELHNFYWDYQVTDKFLEVRNIADVAYLTIKCAMSRKESRGIHFNLDYKERDDIYCQKDTVL